VKAAAQQAAMCSGCCKAALRDAPRQGRHAAGP
jgi:hypothetical protein